ncbi:unnamed protein product [Leptosia nina]|uniref:Uncharacterized protein n=1 Tax=Leptosia nina TaxID=320188 RepID=A0AAV1J9S5_9NEOP
MWVSTCITLYLFIQIANAGALTFKDSQEAAVPRETKPNLSYNELLYILKTRNGDRTKPPKALSPCARAILGCCDENKVINENCSVLLNCGAYFFDDNPCDDKFIYDALRAATAFYHQYDKVFTT